MSRIQSTLATTASSGSTGKSAGGIEDLDLQSFFDLMIAELQNQDPLNPMDNQEMLAQIGQIREISSNDKLSETLDSVLLGQSISSATNLIGANVKGITDNGQKVNGAVQRVTISDGEPLLDLAVEPSGVAGADKGDVEEGKYKYTVVWSDTKGNQYGVPVEVDTNEFKEFDGTIELQNLPETSGPKRVYRSDKNGNGTKQLVGVIPRGQTTSFLDDTSDAGRISETVSGNITSLPTANKVTIRLKNIGEISPTGN
jgi:flagellar basal-body rod modification protein FlgD